MQFWVQCEFRNTQREQSGVVQEFIDGISCFCYSCCFLASSAGKILKYGTSDLILFYCIHKCMDTKCVMKFNDDNKRVLKKKIKFIEKNGTRTISTENMSTGGT